MLLKKLNARYLNTSHIYFLVIKKNNTAEVLSKKVVATIYNFNTFVPKYLKLYQKTQKISGGYKFFFFEQLNIKKV